MKHPEQYQRTQGHFAYFDQQPPRLTFLFTQVIMFTQLLCVFIHYAKYRNVVQSFQRKSLFDDPMQTSLVDIDYSFIKHIQERVSYISNYITSEKRYSFHVNCYR